MEIRDFERILRDVEVKLNDAEDVIMHADLNFEAMNEVFTYPDKRISQSHILGRIFSAIEVALNTTKDFQTENMEQNTIQRQYEALKAKNPDAVLLFRCGDFYESYKEDAEACAKTLGITLTRHKDGYNLAGFPYHALDTYLPRLIRAGYRVAICDQLEAPKPKRAIRELVTPYNKA